MENKPPAIVGDLPQMHITTKVQSTTQTTTCLQLCPKMSLLLVENSLKRLHAEIITLINQSVNITVYK